MIFKITNKYKEFTSYKKGTLQNDSIFFNKIEVLITERHENLESQQGFFIYERQSFSFDLTTTQKLYVRSYKENDVCLFSNMILHNETTNTVLSNKALLEVDKMRSELNTMREVYPIGFTASRNEEEPSTSLQLKRVKENFN